MTTATDLPCFTNNRDIADGETRTRNPWITQEFLCPVEPLYFWDEKSIIVEK